ncbi:hypothetical protein C8R44DRAFT_764208 [Mycena epipterygia]|nr:hypothetical protein C8R44DRAFT_764208 [Mycena epipterygia]
MYLLGWGRMELRSMCKTQDGQLPERLVPEVFMTLPSTELTRVPRRLRFPCNVNVSI